MKTITYRKSALKALQRMPRTEAQRIQGKIKAYASDPASQRNNVKALKGSDYIRLRVGDWRVIIDERGDVLDIINIGARGDVYQ
ncbi:type II toxin-antitoxin system RelE family toxin [Halomonas sp. G11]|uniref:type II toxin-antitoxin system RelE family toxin n=1 Tax=Halomonas sp. G11 TaxID=1684425 RepID=UPI000800F36F|nr:type II toxin-antitoxin system RelE/ParE family toxin [Halomonas sp. G11]OAZ99261.1 cytotoxic translational repressor of toxin-antitoxin stability system [Halomonas sp. G11]